MIQASIRKRFASGDDSRAFQLDVKLETAAGVTVLFGPSGAGKTLTLDAIAGFVRPDAGYIRLDETTLYDSSRKVHLRPQDRRCGYVFQNYALFPHMTLRDNLEFAVPDRPRLERHRMVTRILEQFRLTDAARRRPHEVAGGQQQRCSIARALIGGPRLLLLDEPARGLDAPLRADLYDVLRQVRKEFFTPILLVTHDLEECFELGEQMLVLDDGRVVQQGTPREILDRPANLEVARLLGEYNLIEAEVVAQDASTESSVLRFGSHKVSGPFFAGRSRGDRVWLYMRPGQLLAKPRGKRPKPNQILPVLTSVSERPGLARLHFDSGLLVDLPRAEFESIRDNKNWVVEFPPESLRIL